MLIQLLWSNIRRFVGKFDYLMITSVSKNDSHEIPIIIVIKKISEL